MQTVGALFPLLGPSVPWGHAEEIGADTETRTPRAGVPGPSGGLGARDLWAVLADVWGAGWGGGWRGRGEVVQLCDSRSGCFYDYLPWGGVLLFCYATTAHVCVHVPV